MEKSKFLTSSSRINDILPEDYKYFRKIHQIVEEIADFYRFGRLETSILQEPKPFLKGIGADVDITKNQACIFKTKEGDVLMLRREGTSSVARVFVEQGMFNLPKPVKLWYFSPFFKYEKLKKGKCCQFWQFGFEIFGSKDPIIEAQIIQILFSIFAKLKLKEIIIEVNSIGDSRCRPYYKKVLKEYFSSHRVALCSDCKKILKVNPLKIFECEKEKCQRVVKGAPQIIDYLCKKCHNHLKGLLELLDEIEVPYHLNPYLVRCLDYCDRTIFEIFETPLDVSESKIVLAGGGRYDALVKLLGGKETTACGATVRVEGIVDLMKQQEAKYFKAQPPKIFLAQLGKLAKRKSLALFRQFQKAKIEVVESFERNSLRAQLARARNLGVEYTLILGQKEALEGTIVVRNMKNGGQEVVKLDKIVKEMKKKLKRK